MNKHFKTTGIVIRKIDLNEADRIVTVLTDEFGKIDCIAKGARRLKSKFCGRLELFYQVDLTCFQGRELTNLNEIHLLSAFPEEKDVNKHRILFYIAELTNKLIQSDQQIEGAYPLLFDTIQHLKNSDKLEIILHAYLIKLLTLAGFLSPWNKCGICNHPLNLEHLICLSATDAHVVCQDCCSPADNPLSIPIIKWVNFMQNYPLSDALKVKVDEKDHQSVWIWLQEVLGNLLTSPIKSEGFLQQVG
jgi:DNA repair protein RecO (recombination protein O)